MKLLIINGGARLGNTWELTMGVKKELALISEEIDYTEIHLKDLALPFCLGCSLCFRKGHDYCPHNSIIQRIMDKIEESDGVIFSAPTYNLQMPALTKNLVDHLCFMLHRPRYFDKKALIISTTGGVGAKSATKSMAGTMNGWGFNRCYQIGIAVASWNDYHLTPKHKRKILSVTKRFYKDLESKKLHSPLYWVLIPYNLFRGMSFDYRKGKEFEMRDGSFWEEKDRISNPYASNVPMGIHKKLFGNMFYLLGKKISKYMIATYKK